MLDHASSAARRSQSKHVHSVLSGGPVIPVLNSLLVPIVEHQRTLISFTAMRLEKDREMLNQIAASKSILEVIDTQTRWAQECVRDYSNELQKLPAQLFQAVDQHHE